MKRILALLFLAAPLAFAQVATRADIPLQTSGPKVPVSGGPLPQALWVANAQAYVCTHPSASLSYCQAHPLTTYTDSTEGTPCSTATPLVQLPGSTCTASTGTTGTVGLWYDGGTFDYWIVSSYGTYGPFSYSSVAGGAGGPFLPLAGGTVTGPATTTLLNLTPNAASPAYFSGGNDVAQAINAAAAVATNGVVDATGFAVTLANSNCVPQRANCFAITHTLAVPAGVTVNFGAINSMRLVCDQVGTGPCVTLGDGASITATGRNTNDPLIIEGPNFNGTPAASAIGSSNLTIVSWAITGSGYPYTLTVTTTGFSGNLPGGLVGQNVTLWGLAEPYLNGFQGNVTGVSGVTFTMVINHAATSATESGLVQASPYSLVRAASGRGDQNSFTLDGIAIDGLPSNTNPVGRCLDVQGVFVPTYFRNVSAQYCRGGALRIHAGTVQRIATDIVFENFQADDQSNVDHPGCVVSIDVLDQTVAGSGVSNITFIGGAIQYPNRTPMLCINGNGLGGARQIKFIGALDVELGAPADGLHSGAYFPDVTPIQLTDVQGLTIDTLQFSGSMPAVSGAPAQIIKIDGSVGKMDDLRLKSLRWPNVTYWPQNPIGIQDGVLSYNPPSAPFDCCWNVINAYEPNYYGSRFTDWFTLIPEASDPPTVIQGQFSYNSGVNRARYYDGAVEQSVANLNDVAMSLTPNGGDILATSGLFNSSSGGIATGWTSSGCNGVTCVFSVGSTEHPASSGSLNSQQVQITVNGSAGYTENGIAIGSQSITAGQAYKFEMWSKGDGTLRGTPTILLTDIASSTNYCGSQVLSSAVVSTTWNLITLQCTSNTTTAAAVLRLLINTYPGSTGSFYINYPHFYTVTPLTPGIVAANGPYDVTVATAANIVAAIGSTPVANATAATSATTATNIAGGAAGSLPYQSATGTTAMLAGNTASTDQVPVSRGSAGVATAPTLKNAPALSAANMTNFPTKIPCTYQRASGTVSGTGSNQTVYTCTVPANTLAAGSVLTVYGAVQHTAGANTFALSVGYATGSNVCSSSNTATGVYSLVCKIWQYSASNVDGIRLGSSTVGSSTLSAAVQTTAFAADPTVSQALIIVVNANAGDTYTPQWFWAEVTN